MAGLLKGTKAISNAVSMVILIALVISVAIAGAMWMSGLTFSFMRIESFRMEWGTVIVNDNFRTVNLQRVFVNPIVVCSPCYNSGPPRSVRVDNVMPNSFAIRVQSPSDDILPDTVVHYLVVEEGVWEKPFKIEAGKHGTSTVGRKNNWTYDLIDYGQKYQGNIIVFHQVMSCIDPTWITTYVSKANSVSKPPSSSDSSFRMALNGAEAVSSHGAETISYIIVEEDSWGAKQTADFVCGFSNSPPYYTPLDQGFSKPPEVVIASQQEMDGGDGSWAVVHSVTQTQTGLAVDEDQVNDSERSHTTETCGFIAFTNAGSYAG